MFTHQHKFKQLKPLGHRAQLVTDGRAQITVTSTMVIAQVISQYISYIRVESIHDDQRDQRKGTDESGGDAYNGVSPTSSFSLQQSSVSSTWSCTRPSFWARLSR